MNPTHLREGSARIEVERFARAVDATFDPQADRTLLALAVQPGGKIFVGGDFGFFTPNGGSPIARNHIARLYANGSVDLTFDPNAQAGVLLTTVYAIVQQPNGGLVFGGDFTSLSPNGGSAITRNNIAELNIDDIFANGFE